VADDRELRQRLVAGDDRALAEAYDEHSGLVYRVALRVCGDRAAAEDITQDTFLWLWERPEGYNPDLGKLRAWLCLYAHRRAVDQVRRREVRERRLAVLANDRDEPPAPLTEAVRNAVVDLVRTAVKDLPERQRVPMVLAFYEGLTYREVAAELRIPEGTAKHRLRTGLQHLADRLTAEGLHDQP
jgi:RNA polymerase sigma-70 factor (ECF subfamily)